MSCGVDNLPDLQLRAPLNLNASFEKNAFINAPFETSVFYNDFSQLLDEYRAGIVFDANRDIDRELLNQNTRAINQLVVDTFSFDEIDFQNKYPFTYERITTNPLITPAEVQKFLDTNFLLPSNFITYLNTDSTNKDTTLYLINQFYSPFSFSKRSMGSFCALVPNIFAKFAQFQDIFAGVAAFANQFQNLLSSLTNFSLGGLINGLKSRILSVVDNLVESIKRKISTFSAGFVDLQRKAGAIFTKIAKTKDKITEFLSDGTIKSIKDKISGMISYAGSLFETLDIEEIQFLILRFCSFITGLENFFNGLTKPLEQLVDNYQSAQLIFRGGDLATAAAIAAGATRLSVHQIESYVDFMQRLDPTEPFLPTVGERSYTPSSGSPVSGGAASVAARERSGKIMPITREEIDELPSWDDIKNGTVKGRIFRYVSGQDGAVGWGRAQVQEKVMLMRLAKKWGTITINSAFRTPEYNNSVGGAKNSFHMSGQAFDIGGVVRNERFVVLAKEVGFTGFGFYNSFTHIDTGPPRSW
jgi:hypothetical protein